ncbi:fungal-specific transcription factor domain-containing protein [Lipomyces doorenjongii]
MSTAQTRKLQQEEVEQACDSCRRRKLKCTKDYPICGHCRRHRRECIYSPRAVRSPLTRKYLTQVETRVERLEALISKLVPNLDIEDVLANNTSKKAIAQAAIARRSVSESSSDRSPELMSRRRSTAKSELDELFDISPGGLEVDPGDEFDKGTHQPIPIQESFPDEADGFDWVEQDFVNNDLLDGMAALSINPHGSGYFGSASSSMLLRALRINPWTGFALGPDGCTELYGVPALPLYSCPAPRHVADALIDAYFSIYHTSYPFIHEETFRGQYRGQVSRPADNVWEILFNTILALGAWCLVNESSYADMAFYQNVKMHLSADVFETGSLPLLQALILLSNYVQKRNRPNSGWNFIGLAHRMATGLGLHREFPGWSSSPLKQEMRRRAWWGLYMFDAGAAITFGRPVSWPDVSGIDVNEVSNIHDSDLTFDTKTMPKGSQTDITIYSGMIVQCRFHKMTNSLYNRLISKPGLTAEQTLAFTARIDTFVNELPYQFQESTPIDSTFDWFVFCRYRLFWRYRNLRILAYRPVVLQRALSISNAMEKSALSALTTEPVSPHTTVAPEATIKSKSQQRDEQVSSLCDTPKIPTFEETAAERECREKCMLNAHETILSVEDYIANRPLSTLAVWYALYFLFQAALIPLLCFCSEPNSPRAPEWMEDIERTKAALAAVSSRNGLGDKFLALINGLIGPIVSPGTAADGETAGTMGDFEKRTDWLNDVYSLLFEDPSAGLMCGLTKMERDERDNGDTSNMLDDMFSFGGSGTGAGVNFGNFDSWS